VNCGVARLAVNVAPLPEARRIHAGHHRQVHISACGQLIEPTKVTAHCDVPLDLAAPRSTNDRCGTVNVALEDGEPHDATHGMAVS
jgi:hypothetical protein